LIAIFCIVLLSACGGTNGGNNTVHVYDNAGVLDQNRVQSEASTLPGSIDIYTVNTFTGSKTEFDQTTRNKLGNNSNLIVVAIDTVHHHLAIVRGSNVSLSSSQIQSAISAFAGNYGNGDYTGATIASVDSMRNSLGTGGGSGVLGFLLVWFIAAEIAQSRLLPGPAAVLRYVVSEDCGVMINPNVVEGQIAGGCCGGSCGCSN